MILDTIQERHSVRSFISKDVPEEIINNILEAGRLATSWVNVQPWHFIVVKDAETRKLLSKLAYGQTHVAQAPVVIVCCGDLSAWDQDNYRKILQSRPGITEERINTIINDPTYNPKVKGHEALIYRTVEEVTYATAYMTLEACEKGLSSCIIGRISNELTGMLPDIDVDVRKKLNLPDNFIIISFLLIGYADPELTVLNKSRKSFEKVVSFEKYENR